MLVGRLCLHGVCATTERLRDGPRGPEAQAAQEEGEVTHDPMPDIHDGGPAFPNVEPPVLGSCGQTIEDAKAIPGMSLRDWLAGVYHPTPAQIEYADKHGVDGAVHV